MKNIIFIIVAVVLAASAGYVTQQLLFDNNERPVVLQKNNPGVGMQRPEFAMKDIDGTIRNIKQWDGKIILLNFWATWCPPCKKEIPAFIELQDEYGDAGLQVIGIAIDNEADVSAFMLETGINYPIMADEIETTELAKRYGNYMGALPYTVIIDKNGTVSYTFAGEMSKQHALKALQKAGLTL